MRISFIGTGNMASAILHGLIRNGREPSTLCLYNRTPQKYAAFAARGAVPAPTMKDALEFGELIILAVKPQHFPTVFAEIQQTGVSLCGKTFLSIAAGITIETMEQNLGKIAIIRAMPNTPLQVGAGVTALCKNDLVEDAVWQEAQAVFGVSGEVIILPEDAFAGIISLTGSSPAFVFRFIQALADGAQSQNIGLPTEVCVKLAAQVVLGSAQLLLQSEQTPSELIRAVTSPGGTTEAANRVLEEGGFAPLMEQAMTACTARAHELAKK